MLIKDAVANVGTLSSTTKMPCASFNLPAEACKTGSKLRQIPGSTCERCYAADTSEHTRLRSLALGRGAPTNYCRPNVRESMANRLQLLKNPKWVDSLVALIESKQDRYFRWHDSGDIQDLAHLDREVLAIAAAEVLLRIDNLLERLN